ncbi:nucleotide-binding domain-containing protein [Derxia lacustris]|uniref:nucleotide-binding domain-containing protein n=1 Tax=Derxia lacustris TaxID=764842 RepID=UPI00111C2850|nr:nucleotidyltransferase [Derxia lacustris]
MPPTKLGNLPVYEDKVCHFSHCATIEYAGERKIDIAPCVVNRQHEGQFEVCNRVTNQFEARRRWPTPSGSRTSSVQFADLPTTLKTLVGRLDDWLQAWPYVPTVPNPKLPREDQACGWTQPQYGNFRDKVNLYRGWIDDAFAEEDRDESIGKWQRVFGENFGSSEAKRAAEAVSESAGSGALVVGGHFPDLVEKVKALGASAVPAKLRKLPHVHRPVWRRAQEQFTVKVTAELRTGRYGQTIRSVRSAEPLMADYWLRFSATNNVGATFTDDYMVRWRVTNTDKMAAQADALRGDFYPSDDHFSRSESLSYRGVHFVEAFLIRKRDTKLVGQSDPFYVVIE